MCTVCIYSGHCWASSQNRKPNEALWDSKDARIQLIKRQREPNCKRELDPLTASNTAETRVGEMCLVGRKAPGIEDRVPGREAQRPFSRVD